MLNWNRITIWLVVFGGILLLGSVAWFQLVDPRSYWSEEDALAMVSTGEEHHANMHHAAHNKTGEHKQYTEHEQQQVKARWEKLQEDFGKAKNRYAFPPRLMRYSGTACLLLGIFSYFMARSAKG